MKEFWNTIQLVIAAIGGWLGWFLGGCDGLLYALIAFAVVDYLTGIMCAIVDKKLSSAVGFNVGFAAISMALNSSCVIEILLRQCVICQGGPEQTVLRDP